MKTWPARYVTPPGERPAQRHKLVGGAFVIGLAGTILVTGIAPAVAQGTGALGIILMGVMTIAGCFLCLCLAELATMWPDRTGASRRSPPSRSAACRRHHRPAHRRRLGLGLLARLVPGGADQRDPAGVLSGGAVQLRRGHTSIRSARLGHADRRWPRAICFALRLVIFVPSWFGIRLGAAFATVLGVLSMLPITVLIFLPFFKPSSIHLGNIAGSTRPRMSR